MASREATLPRAVRGRRRSELLAFTRTAGCPICSSLAVLVPNGYVPYGRSVTPPSQGAGCAVPQPVRTSCRRVGRPETGSQGANLLSVEHVYPFGERTYYGGGARYRHGLPEGAGGSRRRALQFRPP